MTRLPDDNGSLTATFLYYWRALDGPELEQEYKGAVPGRQFIFDFCHKDSSILVELDGGTWAKKGGRKCPYCGETPQGQHGRGAGITRDDTKANLATAAGWRVFRFTTDMLRDDPAGHLRPVIDLIRETEASF